MEPIITGHVLWSYDHEVLNRDFFHELGAHFSGVRPFHRHNGEIALTNAKLAIIGDVDLDIPLNTLQQIYLGFDAVFPRSLAKNFGLFWQPLRLSLSNGQHLYLLIDYNLWGTKNQLWFNGIQEILSN
jgi:hypothetical protein